MKVVTSAEFRTLFADLKEPVEVRRYNEILGVWTPTGAPMEEPVKKAIEPEAVKETKRGNLTKGLGPLPWDSGEIVSDPRFGSSKPAPKPGKK